MDETDFAKENFVSNQDAEFFANLYANLELSGGHVILLNPSSSPFYEKTKEQALAALKAYPGGLQVGGGINPKNAGEFLDAGASHVIVTSYVFKDGLFDERALETMVREVGKERLVLDLSSRFKDGDYYITTDRWQKITEVCLNETLLKELAVSCDEYLIHAADVEGMVKGIEENLVPILSKSPIPVTYAGGVHDLEDIEKLRRLGENRVDVTVGSALDIFGGSMSFEKLIENLKNPI